MALQTKAIKQKMKSIGNIGKITKTMEMISVSKMKKAVALAQASKEYAVAVFSLISYIARQNDIRASSFLFAKRRPSKKLIIVISSDKGLCGSYNLNIHKRLSAFKKTYSQDGIDCITVGKYSEKSANKLGLNIVASFIKINEKNAEEELLVLSKMAVEEFKNKDYQGAFLLYTEFAKATKFNAVIKKLMPLEEKAIENIIFETEGVLDQKAKEKLHKETEAFVLYEFEPSMEYILTMVMPKLINSIIHQSFLESAASEHSSRMFAMKNASDSASEIFKDLKLSFNHARQDAITKELSEIVGGANALSVN